MFFILDYERSVKCIDLKMMCFFFISLFGAVIVLQFSTWRVFPFYTGGGGVKSNNFISVGKTKKKLGKNGNYSYFFLKMSIKNIE